MITARNYAAQAEHFYNNFEVSSFKDDESYQLNLKEIKDTLHNGIHFALPDNGFIFNDNFRGMNNVPIKLPFEKITVEFFTNLPNEEDASKIIIVAEQNDNQIIARMLLYEKTSKTWITLPTAFLTRSTIFNESFEFEIFDLSKKFSVIAKAKRLQCGKRIARHLFDLLEALNCKNVYMQNLEFIDDLKNERRIKAGKLPLYETKILVVDSKPKEIDPNWKGGTHASPRQHLRRGHVRHYDSGNIWINNCIVGKSSNGRIDKSYEVK